MSRRKRMHRKVWLIRYAFRLSSTRYRANLLLVLNLLERGKHWVLVVCDTRYTTNCNILNKLNRYYYSAMWFVCPILVIVYLQILIHVSDYQWKFAYFPWQCGMSILISGSFAHLQHNFFHCLVLAGLNRGQFVVIVKITWYSLLIHFNRSVVALPLLPFQLQPYVSFLTLRMSHIGDSLIY